MLDFQQAGEKPEGIEMVVLTRIEKMQREDMQRVMELDKQSFNTPWHESAYLTELANSSAYYIVARIGERIVGYSGMWVIMDEAHITTVAVEPKTRGKKVGEQLLISTLEEAARRGARRVTLEVREHNEVAQRLYRKYGFAPASIRRGYYTDNGEDAVVMTIYDLLSPTYQANFRRLKRLLTEQAEREPQPIGVPR